MYILHFSFTAFLLSAAIAAIFGADARNQSDIIDYPVPGWQHFSGFPIEIHSNLLPVASGQMQTGAVFGQSGADHLNASERLQFQ